jgi:dipeptidyl aminopeptidase/acylaminoacyl peptidase
LLLQEDYIEAQPQISPDRKWMAYASNESGRAEIYVRSLPEVDKVREQISTEGGDSPLWSPDGTELYYRNGDLVMAVAVQTKATFEFEKPKILFQSLYYTDPDGAISWDIHPDGKRFLMMKETATVRPRIQVVINWFEELKQLVPID